VSGELLGWVGQHWFASGESANVVGDDFSPLGEVCFSGFSRHVEGDESGVGLKV
jgi:hypothetical protein